MNTKASSLGIIKGARLGGAFIPLHVAKRVWDRAVELRSASFPGLVTQKVAEECGLTVHQVELVLINFGLEAERAEATWRLAVDTARAMAREARIAVWKEEAA